MCILITRKLNSKKGSFLAKTKNHLYLLPAKCLSFQLPMCLFAKLPLTQESCVYVIDDHMYVYMITVLLTVKYRAVALYLYPGYIRVCSNMVLSKTTVL